MIFKKSFLLPFSFSFVIDSVVLITYPMKKLFLLLTGVLICSQTALAARNPVDVWEANSTAEEVLTGEVIEVNSAPSDWGFDEYFTLQVRTISKTTADLAWGDIIRIPFIDHGQEKGEIYIGPAYVTVEKGDVIKVYANSTTIIDDDIFELAISGDSVEILDYKVFPMGFNVLLGIIVILIVLVLMLVYLLRFKK